MKAWSVQGEYGVIVFESTRGKAKSLGMSSAGMELSEWCEVSCTRMPAIDGYKTKPWILDLMQELRKVSK